MGSYLRVTWLHDRVDDPVVLYSELDDGRWELRKVEVFRNGSRGYASRTETNGRSQLGSEPVPDLSELVAIPEFDPLTIDQAEFERVWADRAKPEPASS